MRQATLCALALAALAAPAAAQEEADGGVDPAAGPADADAGPIAAPPPAPDPAPPPDAASRPPAATRNPPPALRTRVSGSLRSEILLTQRPLLRSLGAGRYAVRSAKVFPFYETVALRADDIGVAGLSIQFQGWAGVDLADLWFDRRAVADPTYLFVEYRGHGLDARLGRQLVFGGVARGLHLDGLYAAYETPAHVGLEAYGGLVVTPDLGPDWYADPPATAWTDDYGAGGSAWDRDGDYAAGGRLYYRLAGRVAAGVSFLEVTELGEIDRRLLGVDLDLTPIRWLAVAGDAAIDLFEVGLREANAAVDVTPIDQITLSADYRHADPTLFLSHMSIFSVFSDEVYDAVGGGLRLRPFAWLQLYAGYHHRFYSFARRADPADAAAGYRAAIDTGYQLRGEAIARFGARRDAVIALDYTRQAESATGVHAMHAGAAFPLGVEGLRATTNGYLDLFDAAWNAPYGQVDGVSGASAGKKFGIIGDVGLFYRRRAVEIGGYAAHSSTPYVRHESRGMVKLVYFFDARFVGGGRP